MRHNLYRLGFSSIDISPSLLMFSPNLDHKTRSNFFKRILQNNFPKVYIMQSPYFATSMAIKRLKRSYRNCFLKIEYFNTRQQHRAMLLQHEIRKYMYEMDGKSIKKVLMHMIRAQEMIWDVILRYSDLTNVIHTDNGILILLFKFYFLLFNVWKR